MKKILAFFAGALLSLGLAFADDAGERSVHWFGFNIPIQNQTWWYTDDEFYGLTLKDEYDINLDFSSVGFNVFYNHLSVSDSRFSKIIDVQFGFASMTWDELEIDGNSGSISSSFPSLSGPSTRFMFGIGGAPLNIDRVVLAIHGTFGVEGRVLTGSTNGSDITAVDFSTFIGFNTQAAFKLTDSFGLSAGMHMYTNLFGFGVLSADWGSDSNAEFMLVKPGCFNIDLKFGVALIY